MPFFCSDIEKKSLRSAEFTIKNSKHNILQEASVSLRAVCSSSVIADVHGL